MTAVEDGVPDGVPDAAPDTARGGDAVIGELRVAIDELDRRIVALLAERTRVVRELTEYKRDEAGVRSPDRVLQVIEKVRGLAEEYGMPPGIAEATYRVLINELTAMQMERLAERRAAAASTATATAADSAGAQEDVA